MDVIEMYCRFEQEIFRNAQNGSCLFSVIPVDRMYYAKNDPDFKGYYVCSASIPEYVKGTPLHIMGKVGENSYGKLIKLTSWKVAAWDKTSLAAYLDSLVPGIGPKTAEKIAEFHDDIFEFFKDDNSAEKLAKEISRLSLETAVALREAAMKTVLEKEIFDILLPAGGDWAQTIRIVNKYGASSLKELKKDVFEVGNECKLPFSVCDNIAKEMGMLATAPSRMLGVLLRALEQAKNSGHTYASENEVCRRVKSVIEKSPYKEDISASILLDTMGSDKQHFAYDYSQRGDEGVYLRYMFNAEQNTAMQICRLETASEPLNNDPAIIPTLEKEFNIAYAPQQREGFSLIDRSGVAILTGGPGTGKTTTLNGIITAYERQNPNKVIRLCAPTGRAAQRMAESTGREAVTIHRLLEFRPFGTEVQHKTAQDPIDADLLVVDEVSMLDIELASILFSAIRSGTLVILVGDVNQLPSVGAGNVLNDMIASAVIRKVQLKTVYRQGADSLIVRNANRINDGLLPTEVGDDFECYQCKEGELQGHLINMCMRFWNQKEPFETQVLLPTHKGDAGVSAVNAKLQALLNPESKSKPQCRYGSKVFRVGDKVVLLANNYEAGYYNGDLGLITAIDAANITVKIGTDEVALTRDLFDDISHAYAMTIHKSQGSEFKNCIIGLPCKPANMLQRNLLYTAVTRAKKHAVVIGEPWAIHQAVNNCDSKKRNSRLTERLRAV